MRVLLTEQQIETQVAELARQVDQAYRDSTDLVLVGVLRGSLYFMADLSRVMTVAHRIDFVEYASYSGTDRRIGTLIKGCSGPVADSDVVLVDEIVDSGETAQALRASINEGGPRTLATCALIVKRGRSNHPPPEFCGFEVGPEFLVGYGLDRDQQYRHLRYVAVL